MGRRVNHQAQQYHVLHTALFVTHALPAKRKQTGHKLTLAWLTASGSHPHARALACYTVCVVMYILRQVNLRLTADWGRSSPGARAILAACVVLSLNQP